MSQQNPPVEQATAAPGERRNVRLPEPPERAEPQTYQVPNKTDAAFDELAALQQEAEGLGLDVDPREPLASLRERVQVAKASRG